MQRNMLLARAFVSHPGRGISWQVIVGILGAVLVVCIGLACCACARRRRRNGDDSPPAGRAVSFFTTRNPPTSSTDTSSDASDNFVGAAEVRLLSRKRDRNHEARIGFGVSAVPATGLERRLHNQDAEPGIPNPVLHTPDSGFPPPYEGQKIGAPA